MQAQQPAFERAVPHRVHTLGTDAELESGIGGPREHSRIPTRETLAQHLAQLFHQRARGIAVFEAHAIGRIGGEEPLALIVRFARRPGIGEAAAVEGY
jgi:hypothetical protein